MVLKPSATGGMAKLAFGGIVGLFIGVLGTVVATAIVAAKSAKRLFSS